MIVVFCGKQGSGKTTLAKKLKKYNPNFELLKIASPVYELHNIIYDYLYSNDLVRIKCEKDGDLLQYIGDGFRKMFYPDIWIKFLKDNLKKKDKEINCIIDDCRYLNEFSFLKDLGAFFIRLKCDRNNRKDRATSWRSNEHCDSEIDLDSIPDEDFDIILNTSILSIDLCASLIQKKITI
ncbi:MAG: AAA family ATPase [Spirochaetota bacterium]|nr:AAA family ATPase [Spirochaetota bacterium]